MPPDPRVPASSEPRPENPLDHRALRMAEYEVAHNVFVGDVRDTPRNREKLRAVLEAAITVYLKEAP